MLDIVRDHSHMLGYSMCRNKKIHIPDWLAATFQLGANTRRPTKASSFKPLCAWFKIVAALQRDPGIACQLTQKQWERLEALAGK
jgi:hypothetical protein